MDLDSIKAFLEEQIDVQDDDIKETMQLLLSKIETHNSLDHDFVELIRTLANGDGAELHKVNKYTSIAEKLDSGSTVIYFKSAGLFRVYQSNELEQYFINRVRTNFRGHNDIFEVVDDNKPQKIVIIIDSRDKTELTKIKNYILNFAKEINTVVSDEDLIVFDNESDNTYEIVVKSWIVASASQKMERVQQLLKYISKKEKNVKLSNKMTKVSYSDIPDASIVKAPFIKKLISKYTKDLDGFVSQTGGNIYVIINNGTLPTVEGNVDTMNNYNSSEDPDPVEEFRQYLDSSELGWYESGKKIKYSLIHEEYIKNIRKCSKKESK